MARAKKTIFAHVPTITNADNAESLGGAALIEFRAFHGLYHDTFTYEMKMPEC